MCFTAASNHHNDYGKWFVAATLRLWHLLSNDDNHHRNINHTESLSGPLPISLEHGELDLAIDRQFVWAMWLYRSTDRNGNE